MTNNNRKRAVFGTLAVVASAITGAALHAGLVSTEQALAAEAPHTAYRPPVADLGAAQNFSQAFADLAENVTPSVVQIGVVMPSGRQGSGNAPQLPEEFRRFFDMPFGTPGPQDDGPRMGGGSGFVVSRDGYIVTNDHVVGDADRITVTLPDHRVFEASLVGTDPTTDVAVIKVDADRLRALPWGSSDHLRVGEWVMAVGNPGVGGGQLDYTVTTGIVSAKGRPLGLIGRGLEAGREGYAIENFIQTDAVINPGNSGGPMLNLAGEVVGMNSAIASTDGHYQGYGFAIPADLVKKVATDLMEHGRVLRPWLGVQIVGVSQEDAEAYQLPSVAGVLVQGVTEGSPAKDAGMQQGDVIVKVDDEDVASSGDLQELIAVHSRGDRVTVGYFRDGKLRTVDVRLSESPGESQDVRLPARREGKSDSVDRIGLTVAPLNEAIAQQLGYATADGVVVTEVDPAGPAGARGVAPGLKLLSVAGRAVKTPSDVSRALSDVPAGQVVTLRFETPSGSTRVTNVRAR